MERKPRQIMVAVLAFMLAAFLGSQTARAAGPVPRITAEELKPLLAKGEVVLLDVRRAADWSRSKRKVVGALREDPAKVESWAPKYPKDKTIVLYCSCPSEVTSVATARRLTALGFTKVYALKGGWLNWRQAGLPTQEK